VRSLRWTHIAPSKSHDRINAQPRIAGIIRIMHHPRVTNTQLRITADIKITPQDIIVTNL
jgi:hypothetical protein